MLLIDVIGKNYYFNNSNPSNKQKFFYIKRRAIPVHRIQKSNAFHFKRNIKDTDLCSACCESNESFDTIIKVIVIKQKFRSNNIFFTK